MGEFGIWSKLAKNRLDFRIEASVTERETTRAMAVHRTEVALPSGSDSEQRRESATAVRGGGRGE